MSEYPKLMVRGAEEITVGGAAEQREKDRDGFRPVVGERLVAPVPVPEPEPVDDEPPAKTKAAKKK